MRELASGLVQLNVLGNLQLYLLWLSPDWSCCCSVATPGFSRHWARYAGGRDWCACWRPLAFLTLLGLRVSPNPQRNPAAFSSRAIDNLVREKLQRIRDMGSSARRRTLGF